MFSSPTWADCSQSISNAISGMGNMQGMPASPNFLPLVMPNFQMAPVGFVAAASNPGNRDQQCVTFYQVQLIPTVEYRQKPPVRRRPLVEFWKQELNCDRRIGLKKSAAKGNRLKRLQNRRSWRLGRQLRSKERLQRLEVKKERNKFKRKYDSDPADCPLWNCARQRRSVLSQPKRSYSRASGLSDLSRRSRSPIIIRSSPIPR